MFFDGDIQSGIAKAQVESKGVVCFVRDESEKSSEWEKEYLQDEEIAAALKVRAVVLRIDAGSQEAELLSAVTPVQHLEAPTLVVINNGQLRAFLTTSASRGIVKQDLLAALDDCNPTPHPPISPATVADQQIFQPLTSTADNPSPIHDNISQPPPDHGERLHSDPEPSIRTAPGGSSSTPAVSSAVASLLSDRREHMKTKEAAEKAERLAKSKARSVAASAEVEASSSRTPRIVDPKRANEIKYAQQQRKQQQDARTERQRILRLVEHDRIERREKEELRRALIRAGAEGSENRPSPAESRTNDAAHPPSSTSQCAIQIRLFDGSTIRDRFSSTSTIISHIRPWIESHISSRTPFILKHITPPSSSAQALSISDEQRSLEDLGLSPSATLIVVPIPGAVASAYQGAAPGLLGQIVGLVSGTIGALAGAVGVIITRFIGIGVTNVGEVEQERREIAHMDGHRGIRVGGDAASEGPIVTQAGNVRTLRSAATTSNRDDDQREFYNGNQLDFLPNRDESKGGDGTKEN